MPRETVYRTTNRQLTAAEVEVLRRRDLPAGVDRLYVKDTEVRGLELRIARSGVCSWAVAKRLHGRQRRFTIPLSQEMGLSAARKAGRDLINALAAGRDPVAERRTERERGREANTWTLQDLIDAFGKAVAQPKGQRTWGERKAHIEREYQGLLKKPAADITPAQIRRVLDAAVARGAPISGRHGLRYLRRITSWAVRKTYLPVDPTATISGEELVDTVGREARRERTLSPHELSRLWRVLEGHDQCPYSAVMRLIVLSGQRLNEVASLRWDDLDLARAEWRQQTNKSDRPHVVPVSTEAMRIIESRPRRPDIPFVFTLATGGAVMRHRGNWTPRSERYATKAGVVGWTRHDLRRTCRTVMASLGVPPHVGELLLNHRLPGSEVQRILRPIPLRS